MTQLTITLAASSLLLAASAAGAQERWAVELRGAGAVPTRQVEEDDLGPGLVFEGSVGYAFRPRLGAYAGWDWIRFTPGDSFAGSEMDFEETGYAFGLRYEQPFPGRGTADGWAWWIRAGGIFDHLEIEDPSGDLIADTGHGLGWEAGTGLALALGVGWSLTPGIRYRSLSRNVVIATTTTEVELEYLTFGVGIARFF